MTKPRFRLSNISCACALLLACALTCQSLPLAAAPVAGGATNAPHPAKLPYAPIQSIFHISKSENRNEVHFAVHVDTACRPVGATPVYGYWRMWEKGPTATAPLLSSEQPAYGLSAPRSIKLLATGGQIRISLRGFPERPLLIETGRFNAVCGARVSTSIQRQPAMLLSIYVKIGFLFSVEYAIVRGLRVADGLAVEEKVHE